MDNGLPELIIKANAASVILYLCGVAGAFTGQADTGIEMVQDEDDDIADWLEMIRSVAPLKGRDRALAPARKTGKTPLPPARTGAREVLPAMPEITRDPLAAKDGAQSSLLPARQVRKLRRQQIPVEARLDLHGVFVEQARGRVAAFVAQAMAQEMRCLEIVTGRGNPEQGTGQLRRLVPLWLQEMPLRSMVLHCEPNPLSRGGSLLVLLRRSKVRN